LINPLRISAAAAKANSTAQVSREIFGRFVAAAIASNLFSFAGIYVLS